jgi:hypothetical protein
MNEGKDEEDMSPGHILAVLIAAFFFVSLAAGVYSGIHPACSEIK